MQGDFMNFELWLFTIKRLAQTMDAAKLIYDGLSPEAQEELRQEYDEYMGVKKETAPSGDTEDIDDKTKTLITIVALVAQGITDSSLQYQIQNAKSSGISKNELTAAINHTAYYAGWPKAWPALNYINEVYGE